MSSKCTVPAQLGCGSGGEGRPGSDSSGSGQIPTDCRPGIHYSYQIQNGKTVRRAALWNIKNKIVPTFYSKLKQKKHHHQQQHAQPPIIQPNNVCCFRRSKAELEECWPAQAVFKNHSCWVERFAIAWWCRWASYYYTVCSSEDHSLVSERFEWMKANPGEKRQNKYNQFAVFTTIKSIFPPPASVPPMYPSAQLQ